MQTGCGADDDVALDALLDNYFTNQYGNGQMPQGMGGYGGQAPNGLGMGAHNMGMGMAPQPQSQLGMMPSAPLQSSQMMGSSQLVTPGRPVSMGAVPVGMGGMAMQGQEDPSNMSVPALQAMLRARQQQQVGGGMQYGGGMGNMGGGMGSGMMRPVSLDNHLTGGMGVSNEAQWRPTLEGLPSSNGMQQPMMNTSSMGQGGMQGGPFQFGGDRGGFPHSNALPAPTLRPASDSLLANQRANVPTLTIPFNVSQSQLPAPSSIRSKSLSAHTAGAGSIKKSFEPSQTVAEGSGDESSGDDSSQRRRVKGRSTSTAHTPSVQEKNRSAQRRFRQRQKEKMSYLENRAEVLSVQVEKLTSENESLRNMNSMLEKVLNLREEHISNLQEAAKVFNSLNLNRHESSSGDPAGDGSGGAAAAAAAGVQDAVAAAAAAIGSGGDGSKDASGSGVRGGSAGVQAAGGADGGGSSGMDMAGAGSGSGVLRTTSSGHVLPLNMEGASSRFTAEQIRAMTADDVIEAWKENLKELSQYVVLVESAPAGAPVPPGVLQRITTVTASMAELVHKVAMINPLNVKRLLATNMELHAMVPVPESHWGRVLMALQLSDPQRKDLLGARERYLTKFETVMQERAALVASLSAQAMPRNRVYTEICAASLASHDAVDRMRANLQREHNVNMEFVVFVFKGVLDLVQVAKASVHSYPYYPDVLAMSNVLAQQQGQQQGGGAGAGGGSAPGGGAQAPLSGAPSVGTQGGMGGGMGLMRPNSANGALVTTGSVGVGGPGGLSGVGSGALSGAGSGGAAGGMMGGGMMPGGGSGGLGMGGIGHMGGMGGMGGMGAMPQMGSMGSQGTQGAMGGMGGVHHMMAPGPASGVDFSKMDMG